MLAPSAPLLRDLYTRMLLTRLVDERAWQFHEEGQWLYASCRGHEAAQVGSAVCIEVGKDFTLPYYRDLGVVLTLGMTPYEVFRTCLQTKHALQPGETSHGGDTPEKPRNQPGVQHWGYHKHHTVTAPAPVATQILHAAGIAFACKLRKTTALTVAYCGDGAVTEPDFLEGVRFAAQYRLPVVFICEQDSIQTTLNTPVKPSSIEGVTLPVNLAHWRVNGADIVAVYAAMREVAQQARQGNGPILLEMCVSRATPADQGPARHDPLFVCQRYLQEQGAWDAGWASQLRERLTSEVEQAMRDAMRDNTN